MCEHSALNTPCDVGYAYAPGPQNNPKASRASVDELLMTAARESANAPNRALKRRVRQRLHKKLGAILTLEEFESAKDRFRAMEEQQSGRGTGISSSSLPSQIPPPVGLGGFAGPGWATDPFPGTDHATIPVSALPAFLPVREVMLPRPTWPQGEEPSMQVLEKTLELLWRGEAEKDDQANLAYDSGLLRSHSEQ
mmetsp:Transcript_47988/g.112116  ORF Transcript_47988/g.112116 Transcript_47988/m.112116 type:complete len:195 (+) Transcript_47988:74-658(+)